MLIFFIQKFFKFWVNFYWVPLMWTFYTAFTTNSSYFSLTIIMKTKISYSAWMNPTHLFLQSRFLFLWNWNFHLFYLWYLLLNLLKSLRLLLLRLLLLIRLLLFLSIVSWYWIWICIFHVLWWRYVYKYINLLRLIDKIKNNL